MERISDRSDESGQPGDDLLDVGRDRHGAHDRSPPPRANVEFSGTMIACACAAAVLAVALTMGSGAFQSAASTTARAIRSHAPQPIAAFMRVNDAGCRRMTLDTRTGLFKENVSASCEDARDLSADSSPSRIDWVRERFRHH